jgi:hypothetical protein
MSVSIAKGEGIHLEYRSYVVNELDLKSHELYKIPRQPNIRPFYLDKGGLGQIFLIAGLNRLLNHVNVIIIQIFQGIIDSFGCLIVYGILILFYPRRVSLVGSLIYALWPPSIFYSYHFMSEAFIPIMVLSISYTTILALKREKWFWYCMAGVLIGFSFSFRFDNFLILPCYIGFIIWIYRRRLFLAIGKASVVLIFCILSIIPFKVIVPEKTHDVPTVGVALYNSLGEYPAQYRGVRFFYDQTAFNHGVVKANDYLKSDKIFQFMYSVSQHDLFPGYFKPMTDYHLVTLAYIREIIIEKPILYVNRLVYRFLAYLPSNPFIACIIHFYTHHPSGNDTMVGYRFSQTFNLFKYIDYCLFIFFSFGVWVCRRNTAILSMLCIYFGVLVSHVIVGVGEVYFRNDREYAYFDPRYLLGMVSIWPVFIAIALKRFTNSQ